jgi:hypothetical protein
LRGDSTRPWACPFHPEKVREAHLRLYHAANFGVQRFAHPKSQEVLENLNPVMKSKD